MKNRTSRVSEELTHRDKLNSLVEQNVHEAVVNWIHSDEVSRQQFTELLVNNVRFRSFMKQFHEDFGKYDIPDREKLRFLLRFMPDEIRSGSPNYDFYLQEALDDFCQQLLQPSLIKVEMKKQISDVQSVKNMKDFGNIKALYHTTQRLEFAFVEDS